MAEQIIGLKFVVQGQAEASRALREVADNQNKLSRDIMQGAQRVQSLAREWDRANALLRSNTLTTNAHRAAQLRLAREYALLNGYVRANGSLNTQRALAEMRAAQATRDAAAAAEAAARAEQQRLATVAAAQQSYNRLVGSINPVIAAQQRLKQAHDTVRAALAAGIITRQQAAQTLLQYRAAVRSATDATQQMSLGLNRTGVIVQQAGYQVGDFFVQVQSGTNVMVALGQQATQLIGTFAAFATSVRTVAILSALGVAVPIITAIGAAMMRTSGASKTLEQRFSDLTGVGDALAQTFETLSDGELDQRFGDLTGTIRTLTTGMQQLNASAELRSLRETLVAIQSATRPGWMDRLTDPQSLARGFNALVGLGSIESMYEREQQLTEEVFAQRYGYDMGRETFDNYLRGMQDAAARGDRAEVVRIFEQFRADAMTNDAGAAVDTITTAGATLARQMYNANLEIAESHALLNGTADVAKAAAEAEKERVRAVQEAVKAEQERVRVAREGVDIFYAMRGAEAEREAGVKRILNTVNEEKKALTDRQILARLAVQYGADSVQVQAKQAELARAAYMEEQKRHGILGDNLRALMASYDATTAIERGANAAADAIARMAAEARAAAGALADSLSNLDQMARRTAIAQGRLDILRGGGTRRDLVRFEAEQAEIARGEARLKVAEGPLEQAGATLLTMQYAKAAGDLAVAQFDADEAAAKILSAQNKASKGGRGDKRDPLQDLLREQAQRQALLGLSKEQRAELEAIFAVQQKLGDAGSSLSDQQIAALAQVNLELQRQEDLLKRQDQLAEQLGGTFGNLFMAATKGADSLRQALSNVLSNLAAMLANAAFTQLFKSAGGGFLGSLGSFARWLIPSANGNVFQGGGLVPFANGGVVSSPVMFPMTGGRTGLMGEAGPEAIMPLKRGSDGKLGVAAQSSRVEVVVQLAVPEGVTVEQTTAIAGNIAVQVMQAGLRRNQQALPRQLNTLDSRGTL